MASENRVWTQNLYQELTVAHLNDLQDAVVMSWELTGSSLGPTVPLEGATLYYGQFTVAGGAPPNLTQLDTSRDWRNRVLLVHVHHQAAAADLPNGGGAHNPDYAAVVPNWNLFYTGAGATPAAPPVGIYWTATVAPECLFAASAAGGGMAAGNLCWYNSAGAPRYVMILVLQLPVGS